MAEWFSLYYSYLQAAQSSQPLPAARSVLLGELQSLAELRGLATAARGQPGNARRCPPAGAAGGCRRRRHRKHAQGCCYRGRLHFSPIGSATSRHGAASLLWALHLLCDPLHPSAEVHLCSYSALLLGLLHDSVYLPLVTAEVLQPPKPFLHGTYHARGTVTRTEAGPKMLLGDIYMCSTPNMQAHMQVAPQGFRGCQSLPAGSGRHG